HVIKNSTYWACGMISPQWDTKNLYSIVLFFASPLLFVTRKDLSFRVIGVPGKNTDLMAVGIQSLSNLSGNPRSLRRIILRDNKYFHRKPVSPWSMRGDSVVNMLVTLTFTTPIWLIPFKAKTIFIGLEQLTFESMKPN